MSSMTNKQRIFNEQFLSIPMKAHRLLLEVIQTWIWMGLAGGVIVGDSREGKTTAIRAILNKLFSLDKVRIPSIFITIAKRDQETIRAVLFCIYTEMGLIPGRGRQTADNLSAQIRITLREKAILSNSNRIVLFVDEAQRLTPKQLQVFAELYDKMAMDQIQLTVIFIANLLESRHLLATIMDNPVHAHIRGRFFRMAHTYQSITCLADIKFCLRQYDAVVHKPDNECYTQTFLPEQYEEGFRLEGIGKPLWNRFNDGIRKDLKLITWPAQYFFSTVNILLTQLLPLQDKDDPVEELIDEAIKASGIIPSLNSLLKD